MKSDLVSCWYWTVVEFLFYSGPWIKLLAFSLFLCTLEDDVIIYAGFCRKESLNERKERR